MKFKIIILSKATNPYSYKYLPGRNEIFSQVAECIYHIKFLTSTQYFSIPIMYIDKILLFYCRNTSSNRRISGHGNRYRYRNHKKSEA